MCVCVCVRVCCKCVKKVCALLSLLLPQFPLFHSPPHSPPSFSLPSHCVSRSSPPFAFFFHCTHSLISFPRQCCLEREAKGDGWGSSISRCICLCIVYLFYFRQSHSLVQPCPSPLIPLPHLHSTSPLVLCCSPLPVILYRPSRNSFFLTLFFLPPFPCLLHSPACAG